MTVVSRIALAAAFLAAATAGARAESSEGPYLGGYFSYSFPGSVDAKGNLGGNAAIPDSGELELDNGFGGGALFGYDYGAFKAEAEVAYRNYGNDKYGKLTLDGSPSAAIRAEGDTGLLAVLGNVIYEYENSSTFTPYVGLGLGAGWVFADGGNDAGFAYQGIAGAKVGLGDGLAAFVDYRYLATTNVKAGNVDGSLATQNVQAGLLYTFNAYEPPPPPVPTVAPVPAPAAARSFMVFFDWNSAAITPDAAAIIQDAAQSAVSLGVTRIELTGHADRSGSTAYNQGLSLRRAEAVKAQLISLGLNEGEIVTVGKGEEAPLVPTPDGVREPQNRRVEIVLP
ncbi:OmpA family protein [Zavarzinia compransoris]|nr:OmpA family protein [Zavarzinia compransoris]TDP46946.1 outer membrane protein OmpA-like peptidoglycan-associated protein [Zavarzinia compransoris]